MSRRERGGVGSGAVRCLSRQERGRSVSVVTAPGVGSGLGRRRWRREGKGREQTTAAPQHHLRAAAGSAGGGGSPAKFSRLGPKDVFITPAQCLQILSHVFHTIKKKKNCYTSIFKTVARLSLYLSSAFSC